MDRIKDLKIGFGWNTCLARTFQANATFFAIGRALTYNLDTGFSQSIALGKEWERTQVHDRALERLYSQTAGKDRPAWQAF